MSQSNYIESIENIATTVTGKSAPNTGQYYSHIYSQNDPTTGVPTMEVQLHKNNAGLASQAPQSLNNLSSTQVLEVVRNDVQSTETREVIVQNDDTLSDGGGLPLASIIILIILLGLVAFVYFIIRIWQNNQIQKSVMNNISNIDTDNNTNTESIINDKIEDTKENWRDSIEFADNKLKELLNSKGIIGDSISDKLKTVGSGEFASVDIAWEAHQGAKKLLSMHDDDVQEYSIQRVSQLFKQVFAEHELI